MYQLFSPSELSSSSGTTNTCLAVPVKATINNCGCEPGHLQGCKAVSKSQQHISTHLRADHPLICPVLNFNVILFQKEVPLCEVIFHSSMSDTSASALCKLSNTKEILANVPQIIIYIKYYMNKSKSISIHLLKIKPSVT